MKPSPGQNLLQNPAPVQEPVCAASGPHGVRPRAAEEAARPWDLVAASEGSSPRPTGRVPAPSETSWSSSPPALVLPARWASG